MTIPFIFPGFYTITSMGGLAAFFFALMWSVGREKKPKDISQKESTK